MVAQVENVTVDENSGTLTELIGAHATHNGGGTTQIYTVDGTALNGEDYVFTPTSGYDSGGHGHEGITYPVTAQIVDNGLSEGSKYFDLYGAYPNGNTIDYHVTINEDDSPSAPTKAEAKFIHELYADREAFGSHPFQEIGNFIRAHADDFLAAVSDTSQRSNIETVATLDGKGEIGLGAAIAFGGELAAVAGAGPLVGGVLAAAGVAVAIKGALDSVDLSHIGSDLKSDFHNGYSK